MLIYFANLLATVFWPAGPSLPRSVPLMATLCAILVMAWGRPMVRAIRENAAPAERSQRGQPVLVIGAGDGGRQLIKSMHNDPSSRWYPVGILDDDPSNRYLRNDGVPVMGKSVDLASLAEKTGVSTVVMALPSADAVFLRTITRIAADVGVAVKVLPGVNELLHGRVGIKDVRDIDLPDLLGRRPNGVAGVMGTDTVMATGMHPKLAQRPPRKPNSRNQFPSRRTRLHLTPALDGIDLNSANLDSVDLAAPAKPEPADIPQTLCRPTADLVCANRPHTPPEFQWRADADHPPFPVTVGR